MKRSSVDRAPDLFFEQPGASNFSPRLLLISYHFPPGHGAGALRWQKLARYAAEYGWALDVVTLAPSSLASAEPERLSELPAGTRIYGVPSVSPFVAPLERVVRSVGRRLLPKQTLPPDDGSVRSITGGRDARPSLASLGLVTREDVRWRLWRLGDWRTVFNAWMDFAYEGAWARTAANCARSLVAAGGHKAIVTCGPPHMVHDAGRLVAKRTGLPLVIDLRDGWSLTPVVSETLASPLWYRLARRYERRAVDHAALIVTNTESLCRAMQQEYPDAAARTITVMNGCDAQAVQSRRRADRFVIAYAGAIYIDRTPRPLFRAAARVIRELGLRSDQFGIEFMGHCDTYGGTTLAAIARDEGIDGFVQTHPPGTRQQAMEFLARAALLVSLPQATPFAIPSKIFEYMQFDAWVLAFAEHASATEALLRSSPADVVDPQDTDGIAAILRRRYAEYSDGLRPTRIAATTSRFHRSEQARLLFDAIDKCIHSRPAPVLPFCRLLR